MLQSVDSHWREHLAALDHLRQGIHLRGYAQKNPKQEYKREAFELFGQMLEMIKNEVVKLIMTVRIQSRDEIELAEAEMHKSHVENVSYQHADFNPNAAPEELLAPSQAPAGLPAGLPSGLPSGLPPELQGLTGEQLMELGLKVGRNDPCPCGSGKKFKACHGKLA